MNSKTGQGTLLPFALSLAPFVALCTLNSAMYRYGASDQAFYVPAVLIRLYQPYFPRDLPLIASQARLTLTDEAIAGLARLTGAPLPALFAALYVASLVVLACGAWLVASRLYTSRWSALALLAALTLRHSIWRTGTNTLEGYFHPRQLAFGIGTLAIAALLRGRVAAALAAVAVSLVVHPTTAAWFALWTVGAAAFDPRWRKPIVAGAILAGLSGIWAITAGPLAGRLVRMDPEWLATLESKDYLFPFEWPIGVWVLNAIYVPIIVWLFVWRRRAGLVDRAEMGFAIGCLALVAVFVAALPFNAARIALAVQLQTPRVFWMLDFTATVYLVWALTEAGARRPRAAAVAAIVAVLSLSRGLYLKFVQFPDRPFVQAGIRLDDWGRVMAWARASDPRSGWLADPMHAVRYGTSLRVAGERDVLVEAVKDGAIGMYDRGMAMRTRERIAAAGDFGSLTAARSQALAETYGLDYLVTDRPLDLPLAFESGPLRVYRLR